jgi:hypothetical protein
LWLDPDDELVWPEPELEELEELEVLPPPLCEYELAWLEAWTAGGDELP